MRTLMPAASVAAFLSSLLVLAPAARAAPAVKETPRRSTVALVVPFTTGEDVPDWLGLGLAELITDQLAQSPEGSWVADKQLDSVLRRKDLMLYDAADPEVALLLARSLGATNLVVGDVKKAGARFTVVARRLVVGPSAEVRVATVEGTLDELPARSQEVAEKLFGLSLKVGPMTTNVRALQEATECWSDLVRHPLQPRVGTVPPLENAEAVRAHCKAAADLDPKFGWPRAGLAILTAMKGDPVAGRADAVAARAVGRYVPMSYIAEAYAARREGNVTAARAALAAALKQRPGFLLAQGYIAEERMEGEEWKAAIEGWDAYLKKAPNHPFALGQKAHAEARLGRHVDALSLTRRALDVDPNDPELLIELASRQIDARQEADAERTLRQVMEARPPRPLAWLRLGYLYMKQNRAQDAKEVLLEAVTYAYREDEARVRGLAFADLGIVSAMQDNYTDALQYLAAAKAEGVKDSKLGCGALEFKGFRGRSEFDSICPAGKAP